MRRICLWLGAALLCVAVTRAGFAQKSRTGSIRTRGSAAAVSPLKGLPGVEVRVSAGDERQALLRRIDVTGENLESQVVHALGRAQIPVLSAARSRSSKGRSLLQLYLHLAPLQTAGNEPMGYTAHVGVELRENAVSSRTGRAVDASVWGYDVVGSVVHEQASELLDRRARDMVEDMVDQAVQQFVDAHQDANGGS
jgi:hypothetical protein